MLVNCYVCDELFTRISGINDESRCTYHRKGHDSTDTECSCDDCTLSMKTMYEVIGSWSSADLRSAMLNIGCDLTCGCCVGILSTGTIFGEHTCSIEKD